MSADHETLINRYVSAYNAHAWEQLGELLRADYVHHNNGARLDVDQFIRGAEWIRSGLPDFTVEVLDTVSEGDRIAVRFVGRGTHLGSFFGEPVTSRTVTLYGTTVFRIADGRIAEDWEQMDEADLRRQVAAAAT